MFNIKEVILFKIIMKEIILSRTCENCKNNNNQYQSNKFFDNQFNRNYSSDKIYYFNTFEKIDRLNNYIVM